MKFSRPRFFRKKSSSLSRSRGPSCSDTSLFSSRCGSNSRTSSENSFRYHIRELEQAFRRFDANGDGKISASELGSVLRSLGDNPTEDELVSMVKEVDQDGDGFIDQEEFISLNSAPNGSEELKDAFLVFDSNGDGLISAEELHRVLSRLGETCTVQDCQRMIRGVDKDGDGHVSFEEFCTMMNLQ